MYKLVRDNIPGIIKQSGQICNYSKIMNDELYHQMLREKLVEEANEFLQNDNLEELADIYTVIKALAEFYSHDETDDALTRAYEDKKALKGEFKERYLAFFADPATTKTEGNK